MIMIYAGPPQRSNIVLVPTVEWGNAQWWLYALTRAGGYHIRQRSSYYDTNIRIYSTVEWETHSGWLLRLSPQQVPPTLPFGAAAHPLPLQPQVVLDNVTTWTHVEKSPQPRAGLWMTPFHFVYRHRRSCRCQKGDHLVRVDKVTHNTS
jgi:hypothetical protein